ncbi:chromatin remodelling complex Rsc7/Swp82 subunit-domain-containing protein [Gongronella butleri]|nr:chromatin remodelling complex Rsc7/Swp82 subunit-domain-containing protein [Gongronella butleri]
MPRSGRSTRRSSRVSEKQSVNYYPPFELDEQEGRGRSRKRTPVEEPLELPAKRRREQRTQRPSVEPTEHEVDGETQPEPSLPAKSHKSKYLRKMEAKKLAQQQQEAQQEEQQQEEQEESEVDEAGEKKVNEHGELLEGREYKVSTFKLPTRGELVLMLAMDPAKLLGFRDSNVFFNKNRALHRVRLTDSEKEVLVNRGMVIPWFKHREVAVVTARSVFKKFGSKIVKKGRRCRDDYFEARARAEGFSGEAPPAFEKKTELMHLTGDLHLDGHYHDEASGRVPVLFSPAILAKASAKVTNELPTPPSTPAVKDQSDILIHQWAQQCARQVHVLNAQLHTCRHRQPVFYDVHTNIHQVGSALQPSQNPQITPAKDGKPAIHFDDHHTSPATSTAPFVLDLADPVIDQIMQFIPNELRDATRALLSRPSLPQSDNDDDRYPLAVQNDQFQGSFPINPTRFGFATPKMDSLPTWIRKGQSAVAQQFYLNQLYEFVGQQRKRNIPMPQAILPPMNGSPTSASPRESSATTAKRQGAQTNGTDTTHKQKKVRVVTPAKCFDCKQLVAPKTTDEHGVPLCDPFFMVACSNCHLEYHPVCAHLTTPKQLAAVDSYPWYCPECKFCCICQSTGDETKLMMCDGCDRGWHTDCCTPPVTDIPEGQWLCPVCAICHSCASIDVTGRADKSKEFTHAVAPANAKNEYPVYLATYCRPCYRHFEEDRFCPVCLRSYSDSEDISEDDKEMVTCDKCDRWIHTRCDQAMTPERYNQICDDDNAKYTCPLCSGDYRVHDPNDSLSVLAMSGIGGPRGRVVGDVGGKVRTRGITEYKNFKVGVPEIMSGGSAQPPRAFNM